MWAEGDVGRIEEDRQREEWDPVISCIINKNRDSGRFPLGFCFVGFLLERHVIFAFVLEMIPA